MKKITTILAALLTANAAVAQWTEQNPLPEGNPLSSIYFTDANTGYIVGDSGIILKTINAGANWITLSSGTSNWLNSVYFINANTGYVAGSSGTILKTMDSGTNWTALSSGTSNWLTSVCFVNANTGYAVGDSGTILKTTNSGTSWNNIGPMGNSHLYSVSFADVNTGYAVGVDDGSGLGIVLKTDDGGLSWGSPLAGIFNRLFSVYAIGVNSSYAVGGNMWYKPTFSEIVKISNGVANLTIQISYSAASLKSVYFTDQNIGYAVGDFGTIIKTSNGGKDWIIQDSETSINLTSVFFTDANTGYALGYDFYNPSNRILLKTTNGGENTTGINGKPSITNTLKIYPNPSYDEITVETSATISKCKLSISNINGQELITHQITESRTVVNISGLPSGVYFVRLSGDKGVQMGKFVKQIEK